MRKGILFSVDAMLALIVVIMFLALVPQQFDTENQRSSALRSLGSQAHDRAVVGFYKGTSGNESVDIDAELGKCEVYYRLDPDNGLGSRARAVPKQFCEDIS